MSRELLKEIIEWHKSKTATHTDFEYLMDAIEAELAKPDPEPIAYITGWYGGYPTISVIDGTVLPNGTPLYAAPPERKTIGYIPQHSAATIKREGMWDAATIYRTKVNPTDVEVYL